MMPIQLEQAAGNISAMSDEEYAAWKTAAMAAGMLQ